ncbi:MAG: NIPSNAP family protein [Pseudomonadota bacterium]|nr:NIPSNAP family protein [Pseudomonadota bacterium]
MIVEERNYSLKVGGVAEFMRIYEAEGLDLQRRILGRMVGYFTTDFGRLHQIVHLWAYRDLAERDQRRAQLAQEPEWRAFQQKTGPLIVEQTNRLLLPASFSPWFSDEGDQG